MGEHRADEATSLLIKYIDFEPNPPLDRSAIGGLPNVKRSFPAVGALVRIGLPAMGALVDLMASTSDERISRFVDYATLSILGYDMRNAYLKARLKETKDDEQRRRLESFIVE